MNRKSTTDFANTQGIWKFSRTANFDTMLKDEDLDRCVDEVITMQQCIDQDFYQTGFWDFEFALFIEGFTDLRST